MVLPVTLSIAAAAALVNLWLALRIAVGRVRGKVLLGDGGDSRLASGMRAQSNFVEYAPFVLILMGLVELAGGSPFGLWILGGAFILARIGHGCGMMRPAPNVGRAGGAIGTWAILALLAGWAIGIVYTAQSAPAPTTTIVRIDR
ncbi:MAPEG family protein [Sphingomonas sanguinis]|uniref:MAPEG family protein n=1 Tax=Sphingomonas sp. LC-1 TaxID=3110957 RepID=UPI0021BAC079|nr:MAPEG family protein [Sphingomonas sp. LC-1]MCT8000854.1 MAPEG family protein [Sphingomonas sp. LC-1]